MSSDSPPTNETDPHSPPPPYIFATQNPAFHALCTTNQTLLAPFQSHPTALAHLSRTTHYPYSTLKRICKELAAASTDPASLTNRNTTFAPTAPSTPWSILGAIAGPPDTPYAGGVFFVRLVLPPTYPAAPPRARFLTRVRHPNVDPTTGAVCVDVLRERMWCPALTVGTVLLAVSGLLDAPDVEPAVVVDAEAARECVERPGAYRERVAEWTGVFARGEVPCQEVLSEVWEE